jgi:hypothetical protein
MANVILKTSSELILDHMKKVYSENNYEYYHKFKDFLEGKYGFSIRDVERFVVNYCREKGVSVVVKGELIVLHDDYKLQLASCSKKNFDQFGRSERIQFTPAPGVLEPIDTTVAQLNHFSWYFRRMVLDYMLAHRAEIASYMELHGPKTRKKVEAVPGTRRKRVRTTLVAGGAIREHQVEVVVRFG